MNGTLSVRAVHIVAVLLFAIVACRAETQYTWNGGTVWDSPLNSANWRTNGNWNPAVVPDSNEAYAYFAAPANYCYVTNSAATTLWRMAGAGTATTLGKLVYVSDSVLTLKAKNAQTQGFHLYAPVSFAEASGGFSYARSMNFCGDISFVGQSSVLFHSGTTAFRYDRYAVSVGESRTVPGWSNRVDTYSATLEFYAPESSAESVFCAFDQTAGSPFLRRAGGNTDTVLAAGATVTGTGIPEGAYLKRVFPGKDWIEISQPATTTTTGNAIEFGAFSPKISLSMSALRPNGAVAMMTLSANKFRAADSFDIDIGSLTVYADNASPYDRAVRFKTAENRFPARIALHSLTEVDNTRIILGTCDILFSNPYNSQSPGMPRSIVKMDSVTDTARLSVTGSMSAVVKSLEGLCGAIAKAGSGRLSIGLADVSNSGGIVVEEGTLVLTTEFSSEPSIASLLVKSDATLVLPAQGLSATSVTFESGATIEGPGILRCGNAVRTYCSCDG